MSMASMRTARCVVCIYELEQYTMIYVLNDVLYTIVAHVYCLQRAMMVDVEHAGGITSDYIFPLHVLSERLIERLDELRSYG